MSNRKALGAYGEALAKRELERRGFRILEQNFRTPQAEIDLIGEKDGYICFIEVKCRRSLSYGEPKEAVGAAKRQKILSAAWAYLARENKSQAACRFDVAEVYLTERGPLFRYTENAFWEES